MGGYYAAMVRLVPMTPEQFAAYLEAAIPSYARSHLDAGDCDADEALILAQADYESLLPNGLATEGQHLFTIQADGESDPVGMLWFASQERPGKRSAYIYDFQVRPELRGKGLGTAALEVLEQMLAEMKITRVSLNVFGWNNAARALYERVGFHVAAIGMTKNLA